jgi:hypothetical protein
MATDSVLTTRYYAVVRDAESAVRNCPDYEQLDKISNRCREYRRTTRAANPGHTARHAEYWAVRVLQEGAH